MELMFFENSVKERVYYLKWTIPSPIASVVISHGMVEHPARYSDFAHYLNSKGINVYGIYHIGHGENAKVLNHMDKGDFDRCISNLHELNTLVREKNGKPVFLFGHSMGSFMSQRYITRYDDLTGCILSGSTKANWIAKSGAILAKIMYALSRNKAKPSKFMNAVAFGAYNKAFDHPKTDFDWLSRDEQQVEKYINDPYCGGICSIGFFMNLTGGMSAMGKKKYINAIKRDLPIYIQGGSMDPVSDMGKGLYALKKQYEDLGIQDVRLTVYEGARHEILNEVGREAVYKNTWEFIASILHRK